MKGELESLGARPGVGSIGPVGLIGVSESSLAENSVPSLYSSGHMK